MEEKTQSRMKVVTTSMQKSFKTCRRRFFFEYIECLKPRVQPRPLAFGTLYHCGLEALLCNKDYAVAIREKAKAMKTETLEEPLDPEIAIIAVEAFDRCVDWKSWEIINVEKEFSVSCGYAKRLAGKLDGIIKREGKNYIIEHKTCSNPDEKYLHHLLWDEQAGNYIYSANEMGFDVHGVFYNIVAKPGLKRLMATPIENRQYTKAGKLYASQRDKDETAEEYLARIREWYAAGNRFVQHLVYRTEAQLEANRQDLNKLILDINHAEKDGTFYRNPGACNILSCPYESICLDDTPEAREGNFEIKERSSEELETINF